MPEDLDQKIKVIREEISREYDTGGKTFDFSLKHTDLPIWALVIRSAHVFIVEQGNPLSREIK